VKLHTIARRLPDELWAVFEPILPPVVWSGEGRPPASNHRCLHGLLYVLITGIGWEYVPPCFPCGRTLRNRLRLWLAHDSFRTAWQQLAQRYEQLHGINWDKILLDGSKKPSKKGAPTPAPVPSIAPSAAPPST
jgi:transposase